jgi:hypothetical protein
MDLRLLADPAIGHEGIWRKRAPWRKLLNNWGGGSSADGQTEVQREISTQAVP